MKLLRIHNLYFLLFLLLAFCGSELQGALYLSDIEIEVTGVEADAWESDETGFVAGSSAASGGGKGYLSYLNGANLRAPKSYLGSSVFAGEDGVALSLKHCPYYLFYCSLKIPFS